MYQNLKQRFAQACVALSLLCVPGMGFSQVLIAPSNPDIPWYKQGAYIEGINTAMINYGTSVNPELLAVSDYFGNGMAGGVAFRDLNSGFTQKVDYAGPPPLPSYGYINVSPDIIVGNSLASPGNQFIAAAAYINLNSQPQVDFWTITYTSPGVFTTAFTGTMSFSGFASLCVHIDVMAASSNTGITGHPLCDAFVVTWDDYITGSPITYAFNSTLNAPYGGTIMSTMPGVWSILGAAAPDVAAVERQACPTCSFDEWALITYRSPAGNALFMNEWDISNPPMSVASTIYSGLASSNVGVPRVDAPDDYNVNDPSTPGLSYFKVSAALGGDAFTFDNQLGISGWDCTSYMGGPKIETPAIAYGGNNGTQYTVTEYTYAAPNVYMQPIDWMIPTSLALSPSLSLDYFLVNKSPIIFINGFYLESISTPCNDPGIATLVAWSNNDNSIPISTVFYKLTGYGGGNGYSFRPGPVPAEPAATSVYPNPASARITLAGVGVGGNYTVTDMLGQVALSGTVSSTGQQVDVSALAAGIYVINATIDGSVALKATFQKQ